MPLTVYAYEVETNESPAHGFGTSLDAVIAELEVIRRELAHADRRAPKPSSVYSFDLIEVELQDLNAVGQGSDQIREFAMTNRTFIRTID